jgi:hypothetical protein
MVPGNKSLKIHQVRMPNNGHICVLGSLFQISIGEDPQRDLALNGDCFDKL